MFPLSFSLDHVGPMARDVEDCALLYDVLAGRGTGDDGAAGIRDAAQHGIAGLRIGVIEHFHAEDAAADAPIVAAFASAVEVLRGLGAQVEPVRLAPLAEWNACGRIIQQAEQFVVHEPWLQDRPQDYCSLSRAKLLAGAFLSARDYIAALQAKTVLCRRFAETMRRFDALVALSGFHLPCPIDRPDEIARTYERHARMPFNVTGTPAMSVPMGYTPSGLPMGFQIAGPAQGERMLFRIARCYERAAGIGTRRPPL